MQAREGHIIDPCRLKKKYILISLNVICVLDWFAGVTREPGQSALYRLAYTLPRTGPGT